MSVKENLPIMVLIQETHNNLLFRFNSTLWGYLSLFIGISLGCATFFAFAEEGNTLVVTSIFGLFSLIFIYSSIYSFNLVRTLEIDGAKHSVNYVESSLYKNIKWKKEFHYFEKIKTFRPMTTVGSGGAKKTKNWAIQLISKRGEIFPIGYNQFGALNKQKAEKLVSHVANIMTIDKDIAED